MILVRLCPVACKKVRGCESKVIPTRYRVGKTPTTKWSNMSSHQCNRWKDQRIPNHKMVEGLPGLKNCCQPKKNKKHSTPSGSCDLPACRTAGAPGGYAR